MCLFLHFSSRFFSSCAFVDPRQFPRFLQNLGKSLEKTSRSSSCPTRRANKFLLYIDNGSGGPYVADINNEGANRRIRRHCAFFFHIRKFNFDNVCQKVRLGMADLYLSLWSSSITASLLSPFLQFVFSPFYPTRSFPTVTFLLYLIIDDLRSDVPVLKAVAFITHQSAIMKLINWITNITMQVTKNKIFEHFHVRFNIFLLTSFN